MDLNLVPIQVLVHCLQHIRILLISMIHEAEHEMNYTDDESLLILNKQK